MGFLECCLLIFSKSFIFNNDQYLLISRLIILRKKKKMSEVRKFLEEKKFKKEVLDLQLFQNIEMEDFLTLTEEDMNEDEEFKKINRLVRNRLLSEIRKKNEGNNPQTPTKPTPSKKTKNFLIFYNKCEIKNSQKPF